MIHFDDHAITGGLAADFIQKLQKRPPPPTKQLYVLARKSASARPWCLSPSLPNEPSREGPGALGGLAQKQRGKGEATPRVAFVEREAFASICEWLAV